MAVPKRQPALSVNNSNVLMKLLTNGRRGRFSANSISLNISLRTAAHADDAPDVYQSVEPSAPLYGPRLPERTPAYGY